MDFDPGYGKRSKGIYKSLRQLSIQQKKEWRRLQRKQSDNRRVRLGDQFERWGELKRKLGLQSDPEVARFLLRMYDVSQPAASKLATSSEQADRLQLNEIAANSSCSVNEEVPSCPAGPSSSDETTPPPTVHPIDELDHDDVTSFDDMEQSDDEAEDESQALFITYRESLSQLLEQCRPLQCIKKTCKSPPKEVIRFLGTAAIVCWTCEKGHVTKQWRSQPTLRDNNAGDVALSAAVILSGNNFAKVQMLFKFMNMGMCQNAPQTYTQRNYTFDAMEAHFKQMQDHNLLHSILVSRFGKRNVDNP